MPAPSKISSNPSQPTGSLISATSPSTTSIQRPFLYLLSPRYLLLAPLPREIFSWIFSLELRARIAASAISQPEGP
uniref:Uncharacterized protein n=1 Tax=Arundo donax TaxID=35708 RepID=A0A0A9F660_ARUDO